METQDAGEANTPSGAGRQSERGAASIVDAAGAASIKPSARSGVASVKREASTLGEEAGFASGGGDGGRRKGGVGGGEAVGVREVYELRDFNSYHDMKDYVSRPLTGCMYITTARFVAARVGIWDLCYALFKG